MNTTDTLSTYAEEASKQAAKTAQHVSKSAQQLAQQASDSVQQGYRQTRQLVRQQPMESVLVCFAAGLVGGFCIAMALRGMR
jgi:ElaB/YqjD/DUF883 family membrane-anchored ribosome-binding protein